MLSRVATFVCTSALAVAALQCKSQSSAPSQTPDAYAANGDPAPTPPAAQGTASSTPVAPGEAAPAPDPRQGPPATWSEGADTRPSAEARNAEDGKREQSERAFNDSEIVAITAAANSAEIEQGQLAQKKARDPRVRDFAAMMVDHHGDARREQERLSVEPNQSTNSERMQADAKDALRELQQKSGKDFDRAYLELQIEEHRKVLDSLKQELRPAAKSARLKAYLENLQPQVESHLAQAERLQQELESTSKNQRSDARPMISNTRGGGARLSNAD
jgi:putative membrane protein